MYREHNIDQQTIRLVLVSLGYLLFMLVRPCCAIAQDAPDVEPRGLANVFQDESFSMAHAWNHRLSWIMSGESSMHHHQEADLSKRFTSRTLSAGPGIQFDRYQLHLGVGCRLFSRDPGLELGERTSSRLGGILTMCMRFTEQFEARLGWRRFPSVSWDTDMPRLDTSDAFLSFSYSFAP